MRSRNDSETTIDSQSYDTDVSIESITPTEPNTCLSKPIPIFSIPDTNPKKRERDQPLVVDVNIPSPIPNKEKYFIIFEQEHIRHIFEKIREK